MKQERILITGASSGIGEGLSRALSRPGATLFLLGREADLLERVGEACRGTGATVHVHPTEITDRDEIARIVREAGPLDLVFASAGVAYGTPPDGIETAAQVRSMFAVNVDGVMNTVLPAIDAMLAQPPGPDGVRGRIAVIASVAAFIAYPHSPTYCASKAAVDTWTVATAANLGRRGVVMTSICPGFVRTPMTAANDFPMPGIVDVAVAVERILEGVRRGRRQVVFPGWMGSGSRLLSLLPATLREAILRRQPSGAPAPMPTG